VNTTRSDNTVALESHALGTLNYIRASIEAAGSFAVPGSAGVAMGAAGVLATMVASIPQVAPHWLPVWLLAAMVAACSGVILVARQPARGSTLYSGPARKFVLSLCPALLAGAVLTVVLYQSAHIQLIPGMWLLLYGCAVLSASMMSTASIVPLIATMGGLFIVLALVAFRVPPGWHNFVLGVGFGALHLAFGVAIGRKRVE
jgi:hypothetical protein